MFTTFTVHSCALYAVDLMLEWRDCNSQWEHGSPWAVMHVHGDKTVSCQHVSHVVLTYVRMTLIMTIIADSVMHNVSE